MRLIDLGDDELWEDLDAGGFGEDAADVLRDTLRDEYAAASDEEMQHALGNVFDAMTAAESFNFATALNQIGTGAGQLVSDPTFRSIAGTALPIAGGALGTVIGGPVGTALGSQLGNAAASALPVKAQAGATVGRPVAASPAPAAPVADRTPGPAGLPIAGPASPVAGGSAAAAQGLVLCMQRQVLQCLLSAALGQHARQQISGVPVAQVLGLLSQVMGQAAADADELMYLEGGEDGEAYSSTADVTDRSLYTSLLYADNLELAEALDAAEAL